MCVRQRSKKPGLKVISYISEEEQKKIDAEWALGSKRKSIPYASDEIDPEIRLSKEETLKFFKCVVESIPEE